MEKKIQRMLSVMKERAAVLPEEGKPDLWFLYILECADGSYYTGVTKDLERRMKMHESGKASRYTRSRRPLRMLYSEICESRTNALVRECEVKAYPRIKKEALIQTGSALRSARRVLTD